MKSLVIAACALGLLAGPALAAHEHRPNATQHRTVIHRPAQHTTVRRTTVHHPRTHTTVRRTTVQRPHATAHRTVRTQHVSPHRTVVTRHTNVNRRVTVSNRRPAHYHRVFRAPHRYRVGVWHAPRGFAYRRFAIGERIPSALLAAEFFLTSYALYGLEAPPPEYVWVRDGDDAVLVDRYTGEVIEVEYDVFY